MFILARYIAKTILMATLLVGLIFISVLLLISLLGELKSIGRGEYDLLEAILFVLMRLPNQLYQFSPMLIMLGSITGLSLLSTSREMMVMRTSGLSISKLIGCIMAINFIMVSCIGFIGETVGPSLSYKAEIKKENAKNVGMALVTATGVWLHVDNNFIHIEKVIGRQLLENVTRYEFDSNHRLVAAYFAKTLTPEKQQWQMKDVQKTSFFAEETKSESFTSLPLNLRFNQNLLNMGIVEPNEMSLSKLRSLAHYLEKNRLRASEYRYDFWRRILQPFASLVMVLLAIPFVLGTFKNHNLGWRIMLGLILGFCFFILNALLGQICVVYQMPSLIAASIPILFFMVAGVFLIRGVIRR